MMKGRLPPYTNSFFCSPDRPDGLNLSMVYEDHQVLCDLVVDNRFEGYSGVLHGGMIFGILDVMLWFIIFLETKKICMTRKTETEFLKPIMCNAPYKARAEFLRVKSRDVHATAWIENKDGEACARVNAIFREAKDISLETVINRCDFSLTTPEIRDFFLSVLKSSE
jgi:uncharacterized protein (TIGR00369 family)